jgi:prepilin-type N-terminal cleavage/methylation domain-containing protein
MIVSSREQKSAEGRHGPNRPQRAERSRSGFTLIEMLIVISVAGVMLGVTVCTIHLLLDAEHEATRSIRFNTSLARLAQAFRGDMHASRQVELPGPETGKPVVLVATAGQGQIRYELNAHLATRIETEGGREVHRDVFYFPPHTRMRFDHKPDQKLVVLEIDMAAAGSGTRPVPTAVAVGPKRLLAIEAALGRDHRFERQK